MKFSYLIIPLLYLVFIWRVRKMLKVGALQTFYALPKPDWFPSKQIIKEAWLFLYILIFVSLLLFWSVTVPGLWHIVLAGLILVHTYWHLAWYQQFLVKKNIAQGQKLLYKLAVSVGLIIVIIWSMYLLPALLLLPYFVVIMGLIKLGRDWWK